MESMVLLKLLWQHMPEIRLDEFEQIVKDWLATAKHPRFNKPYNELVYQPMLELIRLFKS